MGAVLLLEPHDSAGEFRVAWSHKKSGDWRPARALLDRPLRPFGCAAVPDDEAWQFRARKCTRDAGCVAARKAWADRNGTPGCTSLRTAKAREPSKV